MKKISQQSQKFTLISLKTKNLKKKQILSICKLKNSFWPWTIRKQLEWYKKTVKKTKKHVKKPLNTLKNLTKPQKTLKTIYK